MTQFKQQYAKTEYGDKDEWRTPQELFDALNAIIPFTIDAAANKANTKCKKFWSIADDGLSQSWQWQTVFCNPPHSKGQYGEWIKKAADELNDNHVTSAMVLPFKAETKGFSGVWDEAKYLVIPKSRIRYDVPLGVELGFDPAPTFHSCVAIFTERSFSAAEEHELAKLGYVIDLDELIA